MFKSIYKNVKHSAFTISELLIALGVIAILTAILMPIVHSMVPSQNTLMVKRAFSTVETVVAGMINDNGCYPPILARQGFDDGLGYRKCPQWGAGQNDANTKFITMFTDKLDLRGGITNGAGGSVSFVTKDGMSWNFQSIGFSGNGNAVLTIDVDGPNKGPNCGNVQLSGECECISGVDANGNCSSPRNKGFDKFTMNITPSGKIEILDCWAIRAVRIDKKLTTDTSCQDD